MEYDDEVFARIEEFPDYAISNYARVLSIRKQIFLKPWISNSGYFQIYLYKDKKRYRNYIHRLVVRTFIKEEINKPIIDHINRNKLDNSLKNLRWADYQINGANRDKFKGTSSRFVGVSFIKRDKIWYSYIHIKGKLTNIGSYANENDAMHARNNYIIENNLQHIYPLNEIN